MRIPWVMRGKKNQVTTREMVLCLGNTRILKKSLAASRPLSLALPMWQADDSRLSVLLSSPLTEAMLLPVKLTNQRSERACQADSLSLGSSLHNPWECGHEERLRTHLLIQWEMGYEERWVIVTDLPEQETQAAWYSMRFWIEGGLKIRSVAACSGITPRCAIPDEQDACGWRW